MPGTYEVRHDGQLVVEYWFGHISLEEFIEHEHDHASNPAIQDQAKCLIDLRNATADLTHSQIQEIADVAHNGPYGQRHNKFALVCCDSHTYRQSQMYELSLFKHGVSIITFTSLSVACAWLNVDVAEVEYVVKQLKDRFDRQQFHVA